MSTLSKITNIVHTLPYVMEQHRDEIIPFAVHVLGNRSTLSTVLEIGVRHGGTVALWCAVSDKVIGVDWTNQDSIGVSETETLSIEMQTRYPNYHFICGDSHQHSTLRKVESALGNRKLDLLFIDGDHTYEGVCKDYGMYAGLVKRGGIIAFHDIVDTTLTRSAGHGVSRFWKELSNPTKREFSIGGEWGGIGSIKHR